ncbi:uncharacterized protein LOC110036659 [Phalaenopsis equestris]|uniref:uncharacterized protein LOC110036659 n=1 Tax=Phalaenopsis equestris TaxID=78828 RepID=UPI0009E4A4B8|nr:uncharacterized protein LOC110036659 [Phalaenopsis equestris]
MDRRFSRSGRAKNGARGSYYAGSRVGRLASSTTQVFSTEEYYHSRQQAKSSKGDLCSTSSDGSTTEEELFSHELHGRLCKKVDGTPMNKITDQLVSRIVENRHSSRSVIAKLMGFDELPPPQVVQKEKRNSKPDIAFIEQQLVEARRLYTNEAHKKSREFRDALDMMDANKVIFFAKHLKDLMHSKSSSNANRFNILESSADMSDTFYSSVEETKEHKDKMKDTTHCCTKSCTSLHNHSTYNQMDSLLSKFPRSPYIGKPETSTHPIPTSIVILKPGNQKVRSTERTESCPKYLQSYRLNCRRDTKFHRQFLVQRGECHQLFDIKTKGCNMIAANDIATNISMQVKQSLRSYSEAVSAKIDKNNSSSTYVIEPSLSRESMKGHQEQWKTTRPSGQMLVGEGSSTSDKETPINLGKLSLNRKSDKRINKEHICGSWSYPSGISSNDGRKDQCDELLPGFEDHPNSSAIFVPPKPESTWQVDVGYINSIGDSHMVKDVLNVERNDLHKSVIERRHSLLRKLKYHDNRPRLLRSYGEENKRASREVEDCQDEFWNIINIDNLAEPKPIYLQRKMNDSLHLVCNPSSPQNLDSDKYFLTNLKEFQQSAKFNVLSVIAPENEVQETEVDFRSDEERIEPQRPIESANIKTYESHVDLRSDKVQLPSLRIAVAHHITTEDSAKLRLAELESLEGKRLEAQQNLELYQARMAHAHDKLVRPRTFKIGDLVLVLRRPILAHRKIGGKFEPTWEGPFVVEKVYSGGSYQLVDFRGEMPMLPVNGRYLKTYYAT